MPVQDDAATFESDLSKSISLSDNSDSYKTAKDSLSSLHRLLAKDGELSPRLALPHTVTTTVKQRVRAVEMKELDDQTVYITLSDHSPNIKPKLVHKKALWMSKRIKITSIIASSLIILVLTPWWVNLLTVLTLAWYLKTVGTSFNFGIDDN
ncbi:hypothetical protein TrLO_g9634 [Triparma laevis f. longispina]|uniref:Uncharacterized protein n=1 Tax=Triparma laevis f. longispina TaxID=1714387 RepID=A0A9W7KZH0_9STRA|nr:hypothetical protein TrLO_g9634 [Triparma laevis f. longispina]